MVDYNKRSDTGFTNWLSAKMMKPIGDYVGHGIEGYVFNLGVNVIKISSNSEYEVTKIINKNVEGLVKIYSRGKIIVPKRFLKDGGINFTPNGILYLEDNYVHYVIMEKLINDKTTIDKLINITNSIEEYIEKLGEDFIGDDVPLLRQLFLNTNNDTFINGLITFSKSVGVDINLLKELINIFKNISPLYDWVDIHVEQFGLNSSGKLTAFDLDNPNGQVQYDVNHTIRETK